MVTRSAGTEADHAGTGLMPEDDRLPGDARADPAVFVVVDIGTAHSDRHHLDEDFVWTGIGHRALLHPQVSRRVENGGSV